MILRSLDALEALLSKPDEEAQERFAQYCRGKEIPWGIPGTEVVRRHGAGSYRQFSECVFLPVSELFGLPVTEFRAEIGPRVDSVPVMSFAAAHAELANVFENHERARAALASFGRRDGRMGPARNAIQHSWSFGLFGVSLTTYPRERNLALHNALYERNPDLWSQTTVRLEVAIAWPDPDDGLACIADPSCRRLEIARTTGVSLGPGAPNANRVHPTLVRSTMSKDALLAWMGSDGRRGLSNRIATISPCLGSALSLVRQTPARGPGGASLELGHATLLIHDDAFGLDAIAKDLARFYDLPLSETTVDAD